MGSRILMVLLVLVSTAAAALAAPPVSAPHGVAPHGVAVQGHDPVAYFTENKAVKGEVSFSHQWKGAIWLFSSAKNRALFGASPDRYAPQYGGYCALSVAYGKTAHGAAEAWYMHKASST